MAGQTLTIDDRPAVEHPREHEVPNNNHVVPYPGLENKERRHKMKSHGFVELESKTASPVSGGVGSPGTMSSGAMSPYQKSGTGQFSAPLAPDTLGMGMAELEGIVRGR